MPNPTADEDQTHPVIRWLMTEARKRIDPSEFIEAFAGELLAAGVMWRASPPACRCCIRRFFPSAGFGNSAGARRSVCTVADPQASAVMANSPIRIAYEGNGAVRFDLTAAPHHDDFDILGELRAKITRTISSTPCPSPTAATRHCLSPPNAPAVLTTGRRRCFPRP